MTAEPLHQRAQNLYHRRGESAYWIAWQLKLPLDQVLGIVGVEPVPEPPPPPKPKPQRAPQAGCGCTERKLCGPHKERLERARAKA